MRDDGRWCERTRACFGRVISICRYVLRKRTGKNIPFVRDVFGENPKLARIRRRCFQSI